MTSPPPEPPQSSPVPDGVTVARRWATCWAHGDPRAFAEQYTEDGEYIDHAFRINRTGRAALVEHYGIWHRAMMGFRMEPRRFHRTPGGAIMTYTGFGTFVRDLPAMRATGQDYVFHGIVDLSVDDDGLISRSEEYYSTTFAVTDGVAEYPPIAAGLR